MGAHNVRGDAVQVVNVHQVSVRVRRDECGCIIWRFPFDDAFGFEPAEANLEPITWWKMATKIEHPRSVAPPTRKRRNTLFPERWVKGPGGRPDHPMVDVTTDELVLAGIHRCGGPEVYEARRWSTIARQLRHAFSGTDRASIVEVEVEV